MIAKNEENEYIKSKSETDKNRGRASEDMAYEFLSKVFSNEKTYRSVKLKRGKDEITEIDVLCVLGNKALCVQVKSKGLTLASRKGKRYIGTIIDMNNVPMAR